MAEDMTTMAEPEAPEAEVRGLLAEFEHPGALYTAARGVREAGYIRFETFSPFPIHGMDRAMGLRQSKVGYIVFVGGILGTLIGLWMQWWMNGVDYPMNISGKPFFALWPSVPIMFEVMVLCSALAAVAAMLALNGLPRPYNPLFNSDRFARVTDNAFFLQVEAEDPRFDAEKTRGVLEGLGAIHIEPVLEYPED